MMIRHFNYLIASPSEAPSRLERQNVQQTA
jgi:hypothetical protein